MWDKIIITYSHTLIYSDSEYTANLNNNFQRKRERQVKTRAIKNDVYKINLNEKKNE